MASGSAEGILFTGGVDSHSLELCKMQLVNIAPIVDMYVCNLTEQGSASRGECKNIFHFSTCIFHMVRLYIKQSCTPVNC